MNNKWWTLAAVCTGIFMLLLDVTIVNVALPSIETAFHAQLSDLQWVIDAYALSLSALLLTTGSLADLYGRRIVFAIGTAIFTIGSFVCGVATGPLMLILARAGQGIGGATMFATGLALIAQAFSGRERGTAFAVFGATTGVAVAIGPVLGGVITSGLGWRWIFFVNIPIGVVAIGITMTKIAESRDDRARRLDWIGFVTFSSALSLLVLALIRSSADGWSSHLVVFCIIGAVVALAIFIVAELRQSAPMFPFELLSKPTFSGGLLAAFALSASVFALLTYLTLYLQDVLDLSAFQTGMRFLFLSGSIFLIAGVAGRATARMPIRFIMGPGFIVIAVGLMLMRGLTDTSTWTHLIPGMIVTGIGTGLVSIPLASTAIGVVAPFQAGVASGINSTFRQIGLATGIAALGSILASLERSSIASSLANTPLSAHAAAIAATATNSTGDKNEFPAALDQYRDLLTGVIRGGYVHALNELLLIGTVVAVIGAIGSLILIRPRDFVSAAESVPVGAAA